MRLRRICITVLPVLVVLAGCQASSRSVLYDQPGSCLTKQAIVGETADQDSAGRTPAVAFTTNRDGLCEDDRPAYDSSWAYFEAEARLIKRRVDGSGTFVCVVGNDLVSYSSPRSEAAASASGDCGYGYYFTHGVHVVDKNSPGFPVSGQTYTPDGYNS